MKSRPPTQEFLPEDLEALGLTPERVMEITLGPGQRVPQPPDGFPPLTREEINKLSALEKEKRSKNNPRNGMPLDQQKYFCAPGEFIRISFDRGRFGTEREPQIWEKYIFSFPSGHVTDELDLGDAGRVLMGLGYTYEKMTDVLKKAQSYRQTALWPNEGQHRVIVKDSTGKEYFS